MHKYRWSDLEYVLTVAATGSVAAAARELGVNHTTVLRRVHAFEETINLRLFERLRSGYRPTMEGGLFLDAARAIESTLADLERKVAGSDTALSGPVSVTSTDSIVPMFVDALAAFQSRHPSVVVDVRVANVHLNLDRRESDIAIRASNNPPAHLVGRQVCELRFGVFALPDLIGSNNGRAMEQWPWVGMEMPLAGSSAGEWMVKNVPAESIGFQSNSFMTIRDLAVSGAGFAMLPRHLGDREPRLVRVGGLGRMPASGLWLLSHEDMLRSPRVRAATDFLYRGLRAKRAAFEGTGAG